jgi:hypothetical protein
MAKNPTPGPYNYNPNIAYHSAEPSKYNRAILATAPYYATSSYNLYPAAFYITGSTGTATVTLVNGGQITLSVAAASPTIIHEMSVQSVDTGAVYLLYRS